jgi:hypothetical protein
VGVAVSNSIADLAAAARLAVFNDTGRSPGLAGTADPGARALLGRRVGQGLDTIAVRVPSRPVAQQDSRRLRHSTGSTTFGTVSSFSSSASNRDVLITDGAKYVADEAGAYWCQSAANVSPGAACNFSPPCVRWNARVILYSRALFSFAADLLVVRGSVLLSVRSRVTCRRRRTGFSAGLWLSCNQIGGETRHVCDHPAAVEPIDRPALPRSEAHRQGIQVHGREHWTGTGSIRRQVREGGRPPLR